MKHQRVATMCPLPNSNLTQPVLNPKGVLLNNAFWLCGGLVVTDTGENEPTSWCHTMGERFYIEQLNIKGWKPTLDLRVKMVGHSMVKTGNVLSHYAHWDKNQFFYPEITKNLMFEKSEFCEK